MSSLPAGREALHENVPRSGNSQAARAQHMTFEKMPSESQTVGDVGRGRATSGLSQKGRQFQQAFAVGLACVETDRPTGPRRHIGQRLVASRRYTASEIETEAKFIEEPELPARSLRYRGGRTRNRPFPQEPLW